MFVPLVIGIFLRIKFYLVNRPFWHDECSLAVNIINSGFGDYLVGPLPYFQSAPPVFMVLSKLMYLIHPAAPELMLRFIPLLAGILSVPAFFVLSKRILKNNILIFIANLLFAINCQLIYYAQEFKQYSLDVFAVILCLLIFEKLRFNHLNLKKKIVFSSSIAFLSVISLPAMFVLGAYVVLEIFEIPRDRLLKSSLYLIPAAVVNLLYYLFILAPSKVIMMQTFSDMWSKGFLSLNIFQDLSVFKMNFLYFFSPCKMVLFGMILFISGVVVLIKRRERFDKMLLLTVLFSLLAAFAHIYPFKERVSLYLIPLFLLIILSAFCVKMQARKVYSSIMIFMALLFFGGYNLDYLKSFGRENLFERENPSILMEYLKNNYKYGEYVVYNDASDSEFLFYGRHYGLITPELKTAKIQLSSYGEEWYKSVLSNLPKGNIYWFYYPYDYVTKPVASFLKDWARKNGEILLEKEYGRSYLLHLKL